MLYTISIQRELELQGILIQIANCTILEKVTLLTKKRPETWSFFHIKVFLLLADISKVTRYRNKVKYVDNTVEIGISVAGASFSTTEVTGNRN